MEWDGIFGKGLDDVIAANPAIYHLSISVASNLDKWRLMKDLDLSPLVSLRVKSRYLGDAVKSLPTNKLIALKSFYGTGKTEFLAKYVLPFLMSGGKLIIPPHREQLAKELANRFGIEYRTELTKEGKNFGYALCIDSAHPKANPAFNAGDWEGCWVILDEADQVIWHKLNSSTCETNRTAIAKETAELFNVAERIFLMSADLTKVDIDFVQGLLTEPTEPFVIVNDWRPANRPCTSYQKPQELFAQVLALVANGQKLIIHTGGQKAKSKWGTINLEKMLRNQFPDLKILRIDSNSVAEPGHPAYGVMGNLNSVIPLYDIVIASPTLETGVSVEGNHFDAVICFASGSQTVDAVGQGLERYRANVPRYIWATDNACYSLIAGGSTSPYAIVQGMSKLAKLNQSLTEADQYCSMELGAKNVFIKTWATKAACHNLGFRDYRGAIHEKLRGNGFDVRFIELDNDTDDIKEMAKAQAQLGHAEYCERVANAPIIEDKREYKALRDKRAKTEAERDSEQATVIANRYATDTIDPDLVDRDSEKGWYAGLRLHYALTVGAEFTKPTDQDRITSLAENNGQIFAPDFNKKCLSAKVASLNLLELQKFLVADRQFTNEDPDLMEWHRLCCRHYREIKAYIGIKIQSDPNAHRNGPVDVLRKFLKTIGLKIVCVGKESTGDQNRIYRIESLDPDGRGEIFARWLERDRQRAEAPAPQDIGDFACSGSSTEIDRQKSLKYSSQEKNKSFLPINNRTDEENLKLGNSEPVCEIDQSEFVDETDQVFSILGWGVDRAREFLRRNFGNEDRRLFSQDQMSNCWNILLGMLNRGQEVNHA
jgi:hypothetical protein